jgi:hypothetical protein
VVPVVPRKSEDLGSGFMSLAGVRVLVSKDAAKKGMLAGMTDSITWVLDPLLGFQ